MNSKDISEIIQSIQSKFGDQTSSFDIYKTLLSLISFKRDKNNVILLVNDSVSTNINDFINSIYYYNLDYFNTYFKHSMEMTYIGIYFDRAYFHDHLTPLIDLFNARDCYEPVSIVTPYYIESISKSVINDISKHFIIFVPDKVKLQELNFLSLIFMTDVWYMEPLFPQTIKKIAINHQANGSFCNNVMTMGRYCDYILCSSNEPFDEYYNNEFISDIFPPYTVKHNSREICAIPAGNPKLSYIHNNVKISLGSNKIIYHLTRLGKLTNPEHTISQTIESILNTFKDKKIVIRCVAEDYKSEIYKRIIVPYTHIYSKRLIVDKSSSYLIEYKYGEIMISHDVNDAASFRLASGIPNIVFEPSEKEAAITCLSNNTYYAHSSEQLITCIKETYEHYDEIIKNNHKIAEQAIMHISDGLDYLMNSIDFILQDKKRTEWRYFPLYKNQSFKISPFMQMKLSMDLIHQYNEELNLETTSNKLPKMPIELINECINQYADNIELLLLSVKLLENYVNKYGYSSPYHVVLYITALDKLTEIVNQNKQSWLPSAAPNHEKDKGGGHGKKNEYYSITQNKIKKLGIRVILYFCHNWNRDDHKSHAYYSSKNINYIFDNPFKILKKFMHIIEDDQFFLYL
ncbi:hypothetical protein MTBBW1_2520007 [Desulfamplus magnetovallimortis]|uniref:Uncharacterized protein n=1 Tax=Desulfamplus magnetovallimortis TaxID=1246637 RepID=A0A1W1HEQ3_9BACT|nr:hypothetical protein [Desulfamplus magnetovallimortis]SLM30906.1 hypothetical protein MTBBW1_2520007 [Desulfamplus magnetovallimortis]